jgi:hypothetical protein
MVKIFPEKQRYPASCARNLPLIITQFTGKTIYPANRMMINQPNANPTPA